MIKSRNVWITSLYHNLSKRILKKYVFHHPWINNHCNRWKSINSQQYLFSFFQILYVALINHICMYMYKNRCNWALHSKVHVLTEKDTTKQKTSMYLVTWSLCLFIGPEFFLDVSALNIQGITKSHLNHILSIQITPTLEVNQFKRR